MRQAGEITSPLLVELSQRLLTRHTEKRAEIAAGKGGMCGFSVMSGDPGARKGIIFVKSRNPFLGQKGHFPYLKHVPIFGN